MIDLCTRLNIKSNFNSFTMRIVFPSSASRPLACNYLTPSQFCQRFSCCRQTRVHHQWIPLAEADSLLHLNNTCLQPVATNQTPVRKTEKYPACLTPRCLLMASLIQHIMRTLHWLSTNEHHNVIRPWDSVGGRFFGSHHLCHSEVLFIIAVIFQSCQCVCRWNGPMAWGTGPTVESYVTVMPTAAVNNTPGKHSLCKQFEDVGASMETSVLRGCLGIHSDVGHNFVRNFHLHRLKFAPSDEWSGDTCSNNNNNK